MTTSSRVSSRRFSAGFRSSMLISKCLTKTVPAGNVHSPFGENPMDSPAGSEIQRVLTAPSDQNGTLTVYGTSAPLVLNDTSSNAPVWLKRAGIPGVLGIL